jgi:hypothetical protein
MKLNFKDLFPLTTIEKTDDYIETCHFYFSGQPDILQDCVQFLQEKKKSLLSENQFAMDKCRLEKNPTRQCCKTHAKSNDLAYNICVDQFVNGQHSTQMYVLFVLGIVVLVLVMFLVYPRYFVMSKSFLGYGK